MQQVVLVHVTQTEQQWREDGAQHVLTQTPGLALDVPAQIAAVFVTHHHVDGVVGAEEIHHAHNVRVVDAGERRGFVEEAFDALAEGRGRILGERFDARIVDTLRLAARQVFLDRHRVAGFLVGCQIDVGKPATANRFLDAVVGEQVAPGQGVLLTIELHALS